MFVLIKGKVCIKFGGKGKVVVVLIFLRDNVILEEWEVFILKLFLLIVIKFISVFEMEVVKESISYLISCCEIVKVVWFVWSRIVFVVFLFKVSFFFCFLRIMFMLVRGGKDLYDYIK